MHKSYFFTTLNTAFFISLRPYITFVKQANEVMNTAELKKCTGTKVESGKGKGYQAHQVPPQGAY